MESKLTKIPTYLLLVFFMMFGFINAQGHDLLYPLPTGLLTQSDGVLLVPEAERHWSFLILGLWPNQGDYFMLPKISDAKNAPKEQSTRLYDELFKLNFEFSHGAIIKNLPDYTHLYVALPEKLSAKGSKGGEKELFIAYLKGRCGWTDEKVRNHLHFFKVPSFLQWAQDSSEIIGRDKKGRIIIAADPDNYNNSYAIIKSLCDTYPESFVIKRLGNAISSEGGDMELVWAPKREGLIFMTGRNRVNQYYNRIKHMPLKGISFSSDMLDDFKRAYSQEFYGLRVEVVPQKMLENSDLATEDLFHLDMSVAILSKGKTVNAFVPTYNGGEVKKDAMTNTALDPKLVWTWQAEYDEISAQLSKLGYDVVRLPFSDHPVRCPVNIGKFINRDTLEPSVILGKYPFDHARNSETTPQQMIQDALNDMTYKCDAWKNTPSEPNFNSFLLSISSMWGVMDKVSAMPNPEFDTQADIFRKHGYKVVAVPVYAWGAGGLHCDLLY